MLKGLYCSFLGHLESDLSQEVYTLASKMPGTTPACFAKDSERQKNRKQNETTQV